MLYTLCLLVHKPLNQFRFFAIKRSAGESQTIKWKGDRKNKNKTKQNKTTTTTTTTKQLCVFALRAKTKCWVCIPPPATLKKTSQLPKFAFKISCLILIDIILLFQQLFRPHDFRQNKVFFSDNFRYQLWQQMAVHFPQCISIFSIPGFPHTLIYDWKVFFGMLLFVRFVLNHGIELPFMWIEILQNVQPLSVKWLLISPFILFIFSCHINFIKGQTFKFKSCWLGLYFREYYWVIKTSHF